MTTAHKIIFALDSFKGCLSSVEAGQAAAEGAETEAAEVLNVSDGGDGMLSAFCQAYRAERVSCNCHDALMRPIRADYGLVGDMAIIETAQACGLSLLESNERDAVGGTSYGVGELLIHAFERGARRFIIGLGGTATTDGGFGMLKALYVHAGPAAFFDTYLPRWRNDCSWILASDVRNPLYGPQGAAAVLRHRRELRPPKWCASMHACNAWHSMPPAGWGTIARCCPVRELLVDWGMPFCNSSARRCSREQSCCSMRLTSTPACGMLRWLSRVKVLPIAKRSWGSCLGTCFRGH